MGYTNNMKHKFSLKASDYTTVKSLIEAIQTSRIRPVRGDRVEIVTGTPGSYVSIRAILTNRKVPFYVY